MRFVFYIISMFCLLDGQGGLIHYEWAVAIVRQRTQHQHDGGFSMLTYLAVISGLPTRQRGLTTVEYAIAGALIAVVVIVTLAVLGTRVAAIFTSIEQAL